MGPSKDASNPRRVQGVCSGVTNKKLYKKSYVTVSNRRASQILQVQEVMCLLKRAVYILAALLVLPVFLTPNYPAAPGSTRAEEKDIVIDHFYGGDKTKVLNLTRSHYYSTEAKLPIPNNSTIHNATFQITGLPNELGEYPEWIKLDVGDDGSMDWMFRSRGYGSFGNQTVFSDDLSEKRVELSSPGFSSDVKFLLPKNATIDSATLTVEGMRNIITVTKRWSTSWSYYPFYGSYLSSVRFQTLFPRSAINHEGYIDKIYFNAVNFPSNPRYSNFRVYLANTSKSTLSSTFSNNYDDDPVLVYSVSNFFPTNQNGWIPIDIKDIFYFNNTKNLLVEIRWSGDNGQNIGLGYQYSYGSRYSVYATSASASTGSTLYYRYNFKIDFLGDYPHNPTVDIGDDGERELALSGKFNTTQVLDIKSTLTDLLQNLPVSKEDDYGNAMVEIPINLTSTTQGAFILKNLQVHYTYIATVWKTDRGTLPGVLRSLVPVWPNEGTTIIPINVTIGGTGKVWLGSVWIPLTLPNYPPSFTPIPSNFTLYEDTRVERLINLSLYTGDDLDPPTDLLYLVNYNSEAGKVGVFITDRYYLGVDSTLTPNWNGVVRVKVSATDSGGKYAFSNVFTITVIPVNDEPVATDREFDEIIFDEDGAAITLTLDPHGGGYFTDVEGDRLYYHLEPLTENASDYLSWSLSAGVDNTTVVTFSPKPDKNTDESGPILFRIWADDDEEFNLTENPYKDLKVSIEGVPDPPVWGEIPPLEVNEDSGEVKWFDLKDVIFDPDTPFESLDITLISVSTTLVEISIVNGSEVRLRPSSNFYGDGTATFRARDEENTAEATGEFHILPVNDPPAVAITTPHDGATISGTYTIVGSSSDVDGVVELIEVRVDQGSWISQGVSGKNPWTYTVDTTQLPDGVHTIWARAYDGEDFSQPVSVRVIVQNEGGGGGGGTPPTVTIKAPKNGDEIYGTFVIYGSASDDRGVVAVQIKIGNGPWINASLNETQWTYKWVTTLLPGSSEREIPVTITVRSFDGELYSEPVSVRVFVNNYDTDKDGLPNEWEKNNGLNPFNPIDAQEDTDGDGYTNEEEYKANTDPQDPLSRPREAKKKQLPWLWIIIGVVAVLAILGAVLFLTRKGGKSEEGEEEPKRKKKEKKKKKEKEEEKDEGDRGPISPPGAAAAPLAAQPLKVASKIPTPPTPSKVPPTAIPTTPPTAAPAAAPKPPAAPVAKPLSPGGATPTTPPITQQNKPQKPIQG